LQNNLNDFFFISFKSTNTLNSQYLSDNVKIKKNRYYSADFNKSFSSTLTDFKINQFLPLIPNGNWLIFQLSPFWVWGKKAEKSQKNLICQSRIRL